MKAGWTPVLQANITLSARICFKGLWKRATKRLSDRGTRVAGAKLVPQTPAASVLRVDNDEPNDRPGMDWELNREDFSPTTAHQSMSFDSTTGESFVLGCGRAAPEDRRHRAQLSQHRGNTNQIIRYLYKEPEYTYAW